MKEEIKKMIDKLDINDILHKEILEVIYNYLEKIKRDWIYNTVSFYFFLLNKSIKLDTTSNSSSFS